MKIDFIAAANPEKAAGAKPDAPVRKVVFVVDYPKSGPVLESSFVFPKIESYGVWNICIPSGTETVSANN
jgi:hypothetical protein